MAINNPSHNFYSTSAWFKARAAVIKRDSYLCQSCGISVRGKGKAHVDHKVTRRLRPDLELNLSNLITLCPSCHSAKTRALDTATGNGTVRMRLPVDASGFPEAWR